MSCPYSACRLPMPAHPIPRLIALPVLVTLAIAILRLMADVTGISGASVLNISWLIPVVAVYLAFAGLRRDMGYGGYLGALLVYTAAVRLPVILIVLAGRMAGLDDGYFAMRGMFFSVVLPHIVAAPVATCIVGALVWPVVAVFSRGRQVSYRGAAVAVTVILLGVFIGLPYAISRLYTDGLARRVFKKTPAAYGVAYEEVTLSTADGLNLKGWYLPGNPGRGTVICCHGLFNERSELLEQAVFMHEQGFHALLFDFRHHGESEGEHTTFGYFERRDLDAALRYTQQRQDAGLPIILWGVSMGAANALIAAAERPEISGVIAESPFYSADETLRQDLTRMFRLPAVPFAWLVETITELRLSIRIDDLHIGRAAARIHDRPVLLVGGAADRRMPIANHTRLFKAIPGDKKDQLIVDDAGHADVWRMATDEYKSRVLQFLAVYFPPPS